MLPPQIISGLVHQSPLSCLVTSELSSPGTDKCFLKLRKLMKLDPKEVNYGHWRIIRHFSVGKAGNPLQNGPQPIYLPILMFLSWWKPLKPSRSTSEHVTDSVDPMGPGNFEMSIINKFTACSSSSSATDWFGLSNREWRRAMSLAALHPS